MNEISIIHKVLSIAGSDSGGGAGIQADIKTITALGGFATTAITALTAQNTHGIHSVFAVSASFVERQIDAVLQDIGADAIKTGMLVNREIVAAVSSRIKAYNVKRTVVDPVLISKNGEKLLATDAIHTLITKLFPLAQLVTPNISEAECLAGIRIQKQSDAEKAARIIHRFGPTYVLIKGGHADGISHLKNDNVVRDMLFDGNTFEFFESCYVPTKNTHGTGCAYASAIATFLAQGYTLQESVLPAKDFVTTSLQKSFAPGGGFGTLDQFGAVQSP